MVYRINEWHQTLYVGFSFNWPVNRLWGILFNRFYRLEIHSLMVCISTQLVNCCPHRRRNYMVLVYCCPYTVPSLLPPPPSPPFPMNSIYRHCMTVGGGGGVEMYCWPYSAGVLHSVSDQIQNLQCKIALQPQSKITSKDDIKGLVSLSSFVHGVPCTL
jgi:hypothetical protein